MAHLVKITSDDDGAKKKYAKWCLVIKNGGSPRSCCGGEAFGIGESICKYEEKEDSISSITCPECRVIIKWYKDLK